MIFFFFFFSSRRRHTRSLCDWSSDVCSSDLAYVVLAVPDGDNLDFVTGRMRDLWSETARGTVPVAWSLNPLLSELAPPMLDMYYDTATPFDRFIAAPSGAGYLYPDYADPTDLASIDRKSVV